jgi:hypothetical protein
VRHAVAVPINQPAAIKEKEKISIFIETVMMGVA